VIELPADPAAALPETRPSPLREHEDRVLTDAEVRRLEADNIRAALRRTAGKVSGPGGAAELLGIKPTTLASRIKTLGLSPWSLGS
jgi:transcriptional regulator with GAF, ATPase, and Fis domain